MSFTPLKLPRYLISAVYPHKMEPHHLELVFLHKALGLGEHGLRADRGRIILRSIVATGVGRGRSIVTADERDEHTGEWLPPFALVRPYRHNGVLFIRTAPDDFPCDNLGNLRLIPEREVQVWLKEQDMRPAAHLS